MFFVFLIHFMPSTPKDQNKKLRLAVSVSGLSFHLVIPTVKVILNSVSFHLKRAGREMICVLKCYFKP